MSFTKNLITLSLMTSFAIHSPSLLANTDFEETPYGEAETFDNDIDESLEDFYGDEDFVSIATGSKKLISKAPAVTSVVTSSDIEEMGARTLSEVLETIPGMHVSFSSQSNAPKFQIRGISTQYNPQTLMLVDGTPLTSVVRGDRHVVWGAFPVKSIARIEVIRGPGSALYGADAFAGVINIITKKAEDIKQVELGIRTGSFNTNDAWLIGEYTNNDFQLAFAGEFSQSDGHDSIITWDAQSNLDALNFAPPSSFAPGPTNVGYKAYDVNLNLNYKSLTLKLFYQNRSDVESGPGFSQALDPHGRLGSERMIVDIDYQLAITENFNSTLSLSRYDSNQEVDNNLWLLPPGTLFGAFPDALIGNPEWNEKTTIAKVHFNYDGWNNHKIDFGIGYQKEDLYKIKESKNFNADLTPIGELIDVTDTAEVFMPESDRNSQFIYLQGEFYLAPDWELTAGIRYDNYSDFGSTVNPRLALIWTTSQKLTTKLLYGQAFRAPAFAETTVVNNPIALGNPNLQPETIDTFEIAFNYNFSENLDVNLNIYQFKITDFIDFVPDAELPTVTAQNKGEVTGKGIEAELQYKISSDLKLLANYSYQQATDKTVNDDLSDSPNNQAYIRINWQASEAFSINAQINYVGKRERNHLDLRAPLGSYTSSTLSLSYKDIFPSWDLRLHVTNLLDEKIYEPSAGPSAGNPAVAIPNDLPQAGQAIYINITKSF